MKKFFKALALVLALALVIGVVPAQATSAKIKAKKTLYVDGAKGASTDGTKTSGYKGRVAIYKLAGDKKSVAADHTYKAVIKDDDSVTKTKKNVCAADLGKSVVEIFKDGESLGTSVITVKKNATPETLTITGLENGQEVVCGVTYTVALPRKGVDTDERRLFVDDKAVDDNADAPRKYDVVFTKAGDHKIKFEAFQSAELDAVTTPAKEITVKAVMPQPVSAKQVSATSFAATFEGNMEGLITKDDIANDMIYYKIVDEKVVTGVVKDVKVKGEVVTVTMYSKFNDGETYFFAYGDAKPVEFKTAINDIKYVKTLELDDTQTFTIDKAAPIKYVLKNADGVELQINETPTFTVTAGTSGWLTNEGLYFFEEGSVTVKASLSTYNFNEETSSYDVVEDTATFKGQAAAVATEVSWKWSVNEVASKNKTQFRIGEGGGAPLSFKAESYDADGNVVRTIVAGESGYTIKSSDERYVAVIGNKVVPVNEGSAVIILYKGDDVVRAFTVTVAGKNHGQTASVTPGQTTLNIASGLKEADGTTDFIDSIPLTYTVKDLDGNDYNDYTATITQIDGNRADTGLFVQVANNAQAVTAGAITEDVALTAGKYKTVRLQVEVKDNGNNGAVLYKNAITFVVGKETEADSYKLNASKAALDVSLKNWGTADPDQSSKFTVVKTKNTSAGAFNCGTAEFEFISNLSAAITPTGSGIHNFVIYNQPKDAGKFVDTVAPAKETDKVIDAFSGDDVKNTAVKTGAYTLSGYHVEYAADHSLKVRSSLGTVSVSVTGTEAKATYAVLDGTYKGLADLGVNGTADQAVSGLADVIQVAWEGLNSTDNAGRVKIMKITSVKDDASNALYVKSVKVNLFVSTHAGDEGKYFEQEVTINRLFKDDK